jgi:hypothetical protein
LLERTDLAADVRLGCLTLRRHFGEAAHFGHFQKKFEVLYLHAIPLPCQKWHI